MPNLIAYIPTLNQRHLDWLEKYSRSDLFLISQAEAEEFLPRLSRNIVALPTEMMVRMIESEGLVRQVSIFQPGWEDDYPDLSSSTWRSWVLPDEDVSHFFAEKYLIPAGCEVSFEMIWARWDMTAVTSSQPVIPDVEVTSAASHLVFMGEALRAAEQSSDWWRRVGAVATTQEGVVLAAAYNTHMPNEYEAYIFGDPGINRDAGEKGKYTVLHAEEGVIAECARRGVAMEGSRIYVTTFPCEGCARKIAAAGVSEVFFKDGYSSLNAQEVLRAYGVKIVQVRADPALV